MAMSKLHINIHQGIVDVEGDNDLVLRVYEDFRDILLKLPKNVEEDISSQVPNGPLDNPDDVSRTEKNGSRAKKRSRRTAAPLNSGQSSAKSPSITGYQPSLDKGLDTSKLANFLAAYEPKNNPEFILIFAQFLLEKQAIEKCTMDQIYSCFSATKTKFPKAFGQSFIDTRGNSYGYIDFTSPEDITVTMVGQNHLNHTIKKKVLSA